MLDARKNTYPNTTQMNTTKRCSQRPTGFLGETFSLFHSFLRLRRVHALMT